MYKLETNLILLGIDYKCNIISEEQSLYRFIINNGETIINCAPNKKRYQIISGNIKLEYKSSRGIINRLKDLYK